MVRVDPAAVMSAAQAMSLLGASMQDRLSTLQTTLINQGGMAGTDTAAISFANTYDPAAEELFKSMSNWASACSNMGELLAATANNHNVANAAAANQPPPDIGSLPGTGSQTSDRRSYALPKSNGDPSPGPWWWDIIVSFVQGKVWPNGHQDRLRNTASAWRDSVRSIEADSWNVYRQLEVLRDQDSPDIEAATVLFGELYQSMFDISDNADTLAGVCNEHARFIDEARSEIEWFAAEIVAESAVIWGIGALLTPVTGGASNAASTTIGGANLARIGSKIVTIIRGFEGAALAGVGAASGTAAASARVVVAMERIASLPVATIAIGTGTANAGRVSKEGLDKLEELADEAQYDRYVQGKKLKGEEPRDFDDYIATRDAFQRNKNKGSDFEEFVEDTQGLTKENGWEPQKYAPNGVHPNQQGSRRWDFMNEEAQQAVECKSGQISAKDFNRQFAIDKDMVQERGWSMTYYLKEELTPTQMRQLRQLQEESGGRFTVEIGG